jgi:hypothetical protein
LEREAAGGIDVIETTGEVADPLPQRRNMERQVGVLVTFSACHEQAMPESPL